LWDCWQRGEEPIRSCTLITGPPNELVAPVHDRMPVIIDPTDYDHWLDPNVKSPDQLVPLLSPHPAGKMSAEQIAPTFLRRSLA
jgi:putative SOS response-associated peptidase YedK